MTRIKADLISQNVHILVTVFNLIAVSIFVIVPSFQNDGRIHKTKLNRRGDSSRLSNFDNELIHAHVKRSLEKYDVQQYRRDTNDSDAVDLNVFIDETTKEAIQRYLDEVCTTENITCDQGHKGETGEQGEQGPPGVDASQGPSCCETFGIPVIETSGRIVAYKGDNVTITCNVTTLFAVNISWQYPSDVHDIYSRPDGSLVVKNAQPTKDVNFTCVAENTFGKDERIITLHIDVALKATISTGLMAIVEGYTAVALTCNAEGDDPLTVEWFKDGTHLDENFIEDRHFLLSGNNLLIAEAQSDDAGEYVCKVYDNVTSVSASSYAFIDGVSAFCGATFESVVCNDTVCGVKCQTRCPLTNNTVRVADQDLTYLSNSSICEAGLEGGVIKSKGVVIWKTNEDGNKVLLKYS